VTVGQRIVALLVAGTMSGAVVAVLASAVGLSLWGVVLAGLTPYAVIGWRLFGTHPAAADADATTEREVAVSDTKTSAAPLVGIIMGSQSDMAVMEECAKQLEEFGVPYQIVVASAHRQPAKVHDWAAGAADRGVRVIVAAAGKAAHLGGVVAAYTTLPVITVPMKTSDLGGLDSLLSMVQMPSGVPVACVAINGAKNAAILATQILGTSMPEYRDAIADMKSKLAEG
jgi:5-(carboxyamino)imidazole ribonucleotide mutase